MRFGLQKLTLLDYPGRVACTVFSCGCNFRCPFCHNASLVNGKAADLELDFASLLEFLEKRVGILEGVCFTGGEFLLVPDAEDAVAAAKALGYQVKIDTNGSSPELLGELISGGNVDYVAMDIKNSQEKYAITCGAENMLPKVEKCVELLKQCGIDYEFRTTVTGNLHTVEDFTAIGKWIAGAKRYFLQPFETGDDILVPGVDYTLPAGMIEAALAAVREYIPAAAIRGK